MMLDLARLFRASGVYGYTCTIDQVLKELQSTSDFTIHRYKRMMECVVMNALLFSAPRLTECVRIMKPSTRSCQNISCQRSDCLIRVRVQETLLRL